MMKATALTIPGVQLLEPHVHRDERGYFAELWRAHQFGPKTGAPGFVQANQSSSQRNVLRGLHLQSPHGQGKLIQVLQGRIFDVAVDVRRGSPTFGQHLSLELDAGELRQLYLPPGIAHGFLVLSERAHIQYLCTEYYRPECEIGLAWDDPDLGIAWPLADAAPVLSEKDRRWPRLNALAHGQLPEFDA